MVTMAKDHSTFGNTLGGELRRLENQTRRKGQEARGMDSQRGSIHYFSMLVAMKDQVKPRNSRAPLPGSRRSFSRSIKRRSVRHVTLNLLVAGRRGLRAPALFFLAKRPSGVAVPKVLPLARALARFTLP